MDNKTVGIYKRIIKLETQLNNQDKYKKKIKNRSVAMGGVDDELKECLTAFNIKQWQLAEAIGCHESVLCRRLRRRLNADMEAKVYEVLDVISGQKEG